MASNYLYYTLLVHDLLMELKQVIEPYAEYKQIDLWANHIDQLNDKLQNMRFNVAVVGEFNRGKTSFINALLRKQILPADVVPATATINRITYGRSPTSFIYWNDGRPAEEVEINRLEEYITKITSESADNAKKIKEAVVSYPCRFCENNVDLIDTPGMNDDEEMNSITIDQLSDIDLAIVTLDPSMPVSNTEAHFIAKLIESDQICQVIFVVTKTDTVAPGQRDRIIEIISRRIKENVRKVLLETHSKEEQVMSKFDRLLSEPIIFPVSNSMAIRAYEMGDQEMLENSGFQRLNDELLPIIIRTQHSAAILTPLNFIERTVQEFLVLLKSWEDLTLLEFGLNNMKKTFAQAIYSQNTADEQQLPKIIEELSELKGKWIDKVNNEIVSFLRMNQHNTAAAVEKIKDIYKTATVELTKEENSSYAAVWNKYFYPSYSSVYEQLKSLVEPFNDVSNQIETDLNELKECSAAYNIPGVMEPFYWLSSPIPPDTLAPGRIAYSVDVAVRSSFEDYYQRRRTRLEIYTRNIIKEQAEKSSALVQKLFSIIKSIISETEFIKIGKGVYLQNEKFLSDVSEKCRKVKADYIADQESF